MAPEPSRRWVLGSLIGATAASLAACGSGHLTGQLERAPVPPSPSPSPSPLATVLPKRPLVSDTGKLAPNELGMVPVLMFHRVADPIIGEYDITPDALWEMLLRLHAEGYRPVRLVDLVRRRLAVPRGRTPVVLTFDDSSPGQFYRDPDGGIDPRSGVGILAAFNRKYPRFAATATLFLNGHPFDAPNTPAVLRNLHAAGYELGNHTLDHVNLGQITAATAEQEILGLQDLVSASVPGLRPVTFSLPYGVWPADRSIAVTGGSGTHQYRHEGVVMVGSSPAPSPYAIDWDPTTIPRIRASSWAGGNQAYCASWWLDRLAADPHQRYASSGRAGRPSFPSQLTAQLNPVYRSASLPYPVSSG